MDKLGIKGTLYDLLGYIMPGLFFLFALWLMYVNKDAGNLANTIEEVKKEELGWVFVGGVVVCSYVIGHVMAAVGSFLFENRFVKWIFSFGFPRWFYKVNEKKEGKKYEDRYKELLGDNAVFSFRDVIAYSQENTKNAYETAFVFLSIYGLCRNISVAMLFLLTFHCTFVADYWSAPFYVVYCIFLLAMLHNYFRFRQYYIAHIYASLSAHQ